MADTFTTNLNLTKPEPGAAEDTWGISLNSDLDTLDAIFSSSGTQVNLNPNQVNFADNKKAIFGTGSDLQIYHDGSASYIDDTGTGPLYLKGNAITAVNLSDVVMFTAIGGNKVGLNYNGNEKLATTSTGIDVTGTATMDGLTVESGGTNIGIVTKSTDQFAFIGFEDNTSSTSSVYIGADGNDFIARANSITRFRAASNGDISFYDDTGATQALFWDASAESLGIGTSSPSFRLEVNADSTSGVMAVKNAANGRDTFRSENAAGTRTFNVGNDANGHGNLILRNSSGSVTSYLVGSGNSYFNGGNIGIGTSSPSSKLNVLGSNYALTSSGKAINGIHISGDANGGAGSYGGAISFGTGTGASAITSVQGGSDNDLQGLAFIVHNSGTGSVDAVEAMRIDASGRLLIGQTSSNGDKLEIQGDANVYAARLNGSTTGGQSYGLRVRAGSNSSDAGLLVENTSGTDLFIVRGDGNIGIGTSSPSAKLHLNTSDTTATYRIQGATSAAIDFYNSTTKNGALLVNSSTFLVAADNSNPIAFNTGGSEAARIDADKNFMVGTTTPRVAEFGTTYGVSLLGQSGNEGQIQSQTNGKINAIFDRRTSDGSIIQFRKDGSEVGSIGTASSELYIGSTTGNDAFFKFGYGAISPSTSAGANSDNYIDLGKTTSRYKDLYLSGKAQADTYQFAQNSSAVGVTDAIYRATTSTIAFKTGSSERARINSSGIVMVATTDTNPHLFTTGSGLSINSAAMLNAAKQASVVQILNRTGNSDGIIQEYKKDSVTVGSIGVNTTRPYIASTSMGVKIAGAEIHPTNSSGTSTDATYNLGSSLYRWQDLYLSGTGYFGTSVGIGTTSPSSKLHISSASPILRLEDTTDPQTTEGSIGKIEFYGNDGSSGGAGIRSYIQTVSTNAAGNDHALAIGLSTSNTAATEKLRLTNTGLGIGTSSPSTKLHIVGSSVSGTSYDSNDMLTLENNSFSALNIVASPTTASTIVFSDDTRAVGYIQYNHSGNYMRFNSNGSERARIDASGNLLVGQTSQSPNTVGVSLNNNGNISAKRDGGIVALFNRATSDGEIISIRKNDVTVGSIGANAGVMTLASPNGNKHYVSNSALFPSADNILDLGTSSQSYKDLYLSGTANVNKVEVGDGTDSGVIAPYNLYLTSGNSNVHIFNKADGSEKARIDASGNLLIGKTSANIGTVGHQLLSDSGGDYAAHTSNGTRALLLNRLTSDGTLVEFRKDGTLHGNIGIPDSSTGSQLVIAAGISGTNTGVGLRFISFTNPVMLPCRDDGSNYDNAVDLGSSTARFDDIYATNSTIQTSDRNEKQDIQELSDAEQRVATACKGLIRRYKFNSAVTEKGDDARYHFGIIAQDLQDAFTAEGLDAGDYGMFISSTYTDDNGIEQTRLGVRYNELLAFIIATL